MPLGGNYESRANPLYSACNTRKFRDLHFFEMYDQIEFEYDRATGKQNVVARKNRMFEGPTPLTLEGE
jgi:hypothetical protein